MNSLATKSKGKPEVIIIEQPSTKGTRFRYECEGRYSNIIYGVSCKNSFPTIRVLNYNGPLSIIVSCVSKDPPHHPHPHKLVYGNNLNKFGVCCFRLPNNQHDISFKNLSIQCVARRNIEDALTEREQINVDPFKTGYGHKHQPELIDLNCIRLCFQVILETGKKSIPLEPIVSQPVYDKRSVNDLEICWLSHNSASIAGGTQMCILCEKVSRTDIEVRFFQEETGWEASGTLVEPKIFKQVAIVFQTPAYCTDECSPEHIREPVDVLVQLRRKSDGKTSLPKPFQFVPLASFGQQGIVNQNSLKRKREKYNAGISGEIARRLQAQVLGKPSLIHASQFEVERAWEQPPAAKIIKTEPWELPPVDAVLNQPQQLSSYSMINNFNVNPAYRATPAESTSMNVAPNLMDATLVPEVASTSGQYYYNIPSDQAAKSQQKCNSTDTLGSDSWIKDLLETINEDQETQVYKVAREPEPEHAMTAASSSQWLENTYSYSNDLLNMNGPAQVDNYLSSYTQQAGSCENFTMNNRAPSNAYVTNTPVNFNQNNEQNNRGNYREFINSINNLYKVPSNGYPMNF